MRIEVKRGASRPLKGYNRRTSTCKSRVKAAKTLSILVYLITLIFFSIKTICLSGAAEWHRMVDCKMIESVDN
ncbi:hypothetical protein L484_024129 [Morus notabilis]|uniref:Transmembrane protein n=1 Tax=Morus notabilis TaxID=981085 RepID=W9SBB9_9ROSA|nr:hypothetical protein L484_024129 [Morus notabilis]